MTVNINSRAILEANRAGSALRILNENAKLVQKSVGRMSDGVVIGMNKIGKAALSAASQIRTIAISPSLKRDISGVVLELNQGLSKATPGLNQGLSKMIPMLKKGLSTVSPTLKQGLTDAMDLEGYKLQLQNATKDTKKASDIMKNVIVMANKTPFKTDELVNAASKFELMGLSAEKYLPLVGDMASSSNKGMDDSVEALVDAQSGKMEKIGDFGVEMSMVQKQADEMFGKNMTVNNKGIITNQENFNKALEVVMANRFKGGMDKQSQTLRGKLSTIESIFKGGIVTLLGMTADGPVKGSIFDIISSKVGLLASKFEELQKNGTIEMIGKQMAESFTKIYDTIAKIVTFIVDNQKTFEFVGVMVLGFTAGVKAGQAFAAIMGIIKLATIETSVAFALSPFGLILIVVMAIVAAGYILIKNWDFIMAKGMMLWTSITTLFTNIKAVFINAFTGIGTVIGNVFIAIGNIANNFMLTCYTTITGLWNSITLLVGGFWNIFAPVITTIKDGFVNAFIGIGTAIGNVFTGIGNTVKGALFGWVNSCIKMLNCLIYGIQKIKFTIPKGLPFAGAGIDLSVIQPIALIGENAKGTSNWRGGLTGINERGGEIIDLPSGSRVYPHDKSVQMAKESGGHSININIGTLVGDDALAERVGGIIASKIKLQLANI